LRALHSRQARMGAFDVDFHEKTTLAHREDTWTPPPARSFI